MTFWNTRRRVRGTVVLVAAALGLGSCAAAEEPEEPILISGSATVEPVTSAMAQQAGADVEITAEGTIDGFDRFCRGETAINNASVPIPGQESEVDYQQRCAEHGVDYIELPIGLDALTLVRNDAVEFADDLSVDQLERLWSAESGVHQWVDLDPGWPAEDIALYGRPEGSGTLRHFVTEVLGQEGEIRQDYQGSDEIDELSGWIAADPAGLGFMGVGNYLATDGEIRRSLNNVSIDGVAPTLDNAQSRDYPLTRPLFLYVAVDALEEQSVHDFVEHYVANVEQTLPRVYYYALPEEAYELIETRLQERTTGTVFDGVDPGEADVVKLLKEG